MQTPERKIVFFDIDNTLWDYHLIIPDSTRSAIKKLRQNGHLAFINSGRSRGFIRSEELFSIGFDGVVSSCGEMIECTPDCLKTSDAGDREIPKAVPREHFTDITVKMDWERVVFSYEMSARDLERCIRTVRKYKMRPILEGKEYLYFDDEDFGHDAYGDRVRGEMGDALRSIRDHWGRWEASKFSCAMDDPELIKPCFEELSDLLSYLVHTDTVAEMVPLGFSKGTGIEKVCELTGVPVRNTVSIGDSVNDLEMLRAAGLGVAMGNGTKVAKETADYVTTGIHEDGIRNALQYLDLI